MITIRLALIYCIFFLPIAQAKNIPDIYLKVAEDKQVPANILYAIALTESGYKYRSIYNPWPWTLNIEGDAYRFTSYQSALEKLKEAIHNNQIVDAGVMQINWRWHKDKFQNISSILDPYINLQQGANILLSQYRLSQDWWLAVGHYHAPGKDAKSLKRAENYRQRVRKNWLLIKPESNIKINQEIK